MKQYYIDLVNLPGAPSFERHVKNYMKTFMAKHTDTIIEDRLGSVFGVLNASSTGPKVMIAGHMDEVGGMVTGITKQGLIKMIPLGGMSGSVFLSQHMIIYTDNLEEIPGVTASKPPHLTRGQKPDAPLKFEELLVDIGADDDDHAKALGVKIGQQIIPRNHYTPTKDGKKHISKAWDNRFGCAMALDVLETIKDIPLDCALYIGATVQEEVGLRGAATAAGLVKPDIFLAVDASPCADSFEGDEVSGRMGEGFLVRFYDPNALMHRGFRQHIETLAEQHGIKYQYYQSKGGTDAARVQLHEAGVVVATIGMPARYIHSTTAMIHDDDVQAVKAIFIELLKSFNTQTYEAIKAGV